MSGLGALRKLNLDHFDIFISGLLAETCQGLKLPSSCRQPKVSTAYFPNKVATLAMIRADRPFARIMGERTFF